MTWPHRYELSPEAVARREQRDLETGGGTRHAQGLCGYMASLCGECQADEEADMNAWAATTPPPLPGESPCAYWMRIHEEATALTGQSPRAWHDAWFTVAAGKVWPKEKGVAR